MENSIVIMVNNDGMGKADQKLQHKLMEIFLGLINQNELFPSAICFYTDGVKLVVKGSPVLQALREIETRGTRLIICRTCLEYLGLLDNVQVGIVGGMTDIIEAQWNAGKVITL
jgi:hypothetical protein